MTPAGSVKGNAALTARFLHKTRLCNYYASGHCARGSDCGFAHGSGELRTAPDFSYTQQCRSFAKTGACGQGDACKFAHSWEQQRDWHCRGAGRGKRGPERDSPQSAAQDPAPCAPDFPACALPAGAGRPALGAPPGAAPGAPRAAPRERQRQPQREAPRLQQVPAAEAVRCPRQPQQPQHPPPPPRAAGGLAPDLSPEPALGAAPRGREVPALRGQESASQLNAVVKRTFLHFFVPGDEGAFDHRRCSSAPPLMRTG
ncbi:unnamed protein product [Prorocentrum cordatum]|uniref:C3H1-type domain-containing protein n=1 Tax=Prorocentrum cordatum TaxID=2364126 RepID=A0ABN9X2S5_9DINO|nr:unnamed protein product [Polarella glacialis]